MEYDKKLKEELKQQERVESSKKRKHALKANLQISMRELKNAPYVKKGNKAANIKMA
jgi:hypothetical protein